MQQLLGFHAVCTETDRSKLAEAMNAAAAASGMTLVATQDQKPVSRTYGGGERPPIDVYMDLSGSDARVLVGPLERSVVEAWGAETLAAYLTRLSRGLGVRLGRSFRGGGGGHGIVQPQELGGALEFVDWFQYFSAGIVARWGASYVAAGPFWKTERFEDGSMVVLLGRDPFEGLGSRKAAAEYLGIELRPLLGKDFHGNPIELEWK